MTSVPEADGGDVELNVGLPTDESDQGPSSIQGAEGGDPTPVDLPPEESGQGPNLPQGAEGGDPIPGLQMQFSVAAIGNEEITEDEINEVAAEAHKHMGTYFTSLDRFCSKFGMNHKDYKRVLEEEESKAVPDQLFYAIMNWHAQKPQTKEAFRKSLSQVHEQLGISYVRYVNGRKNDQQ